MVDLPHFDTEADFFDCLSLIPFGDFDILDCESSKGIFCEHAIEQFFQFVTETNIIIICFFLPKSIVMVYEEIIVSEFFSFVGFFFDKREFSCEANKEDNSN